VSFHRFRRRAPARRAGPEPLQRGHGAVLAANRGGICGWAVHPRSQAVGNHQW